MPNNHKHTFYLLLCLLLLLAGCHRKATTDTNGQARLKPTDVPETPFIMEGDYTPDTGIVYKVLVGDDTCFVVVDSITSKQMFGHYYQILDGSNCAERKAFNLDTHWKNKRKEATVYQYQPYHYEAIEDPHYRREYLKVKTINSIEYGQALGYWSSMKINHTEKYGEMLAAGLKNSLKATVQSLTLDLYLPDDSNAKRPLLLLLHGGGFYVGDKQDSAICLLCRHFAAMGYVAASANYRLGFRPSKHDITRSGYRAVQDAHAAMRFLVNNADDYGIDTSLLFIGGCSAGAITALNVAFMTDKERPQQTFSNNNRRDLGPIASSGNSLTNTFHIKAVANMWGAVNNLDMLKNSNTDIISFHGDHDLTVPYDNNYPFNDISFKIGKRMFDRMYGSLAIDKRAKELGRTSELHTFKGAKHAPHLNDNGTINKKNFNLIRNTMTSFLYREITGRQATIEEDRDDTRHYYVSPDNATVEAWGVEGGFVVRRQGNDIWVVWLDDAPHHILQATGHYLSNVAFATSKTIIDDTTGIAEKTRSN